MHAGTYYRIEWETYEESSVRSFRNENSARGLFAGIVKNSDTLNAVIYRIADGVRQKLDSYHKRRETRREVRPLAAATYDPLANWS